MAAVAAIRSTEPMLRVIRHPNGVRLYVAHQRIHHGATGCVLLAAATLRRKRAALLCAALLVAHDRRDWRVWFAKETLT
jgi:hypothetical protein